MSKLIDKLHQASQAMPNPLGFKTALPTRAKPKLVFIVNVNLTNVNSTNLAEYVSGADAGLLHLSPDSGIEAIQAAARSLSQTPWGCLLEGSSQGQMEELVKAGCDFVVFPEVTTPLALPQPDKAGRIIQVEASLSDSLLRTINDLLIDAVLLSNPAGKEGVLTWHHLMIFRHFASLLTKPLLVTIPKQETSSEFQALWEVGIDGIVIEAESGQPGKVAELQQALDKLDFSTPRKRGKIEALLPQIAREPEPELEPEPEPEEE